MKAMLMKTETASPPGAPPLRRRPRPRPASGSAYLITLLALVVLTSDRGLCGAYNANVIKAAERELDEIRNDITRETPASFEPSIDYVVTKVPRFAFEKFPQADARLTTQMKSVGEVMAIGRTFQESLHKALRGLEIGKAGLDPAANLTAEGARDLVISEIRQPSAERLWYIADAFRMGATLDEVFEHTQIDRWFLVQIEDLVRDAGLREGPVAVRDLPQWQGARKILVLRVSEEELARYYDPQ